jgi:hypothetical protein
LKIPNLVNTKDGRQTIVNITSNKELDETQVIPKKSDSKTSEASKSKTKNVTKKTIKTLKTTEKNIKVKKRGNLLSVKLKPMKKKEKKDVNSITSNLSGSKDTDVMLQQTPMNNSPVKGKPEKQNISGEKKKQTNSAKDKEVKKKVNKKITIENLESNVTKTKVTKTKSVKSDGEVKKKMKKNGKKEKENKGLKRKLDQIEIIDTESDDDDNVIVKYSISPNSKILKTGNSLNKAENVSTSQIEIPRNLGKELSKKTLQVKVKPMNHTDASSHMKKMRLIDTMKSNPGFSKSGKIRNTILLHIIYSSLQLS